METKRIGFQTPIAPGPIHSSARRACPNLLKPTLSCAVPNTAIVHLDLFLPSVAIYIIIACGLVSCYCSQSLFHNPTEPPWLLSEPVAPSDLRFPPRSTHIIIPSILISSVRSSYSHPDLLLITSTTTPLFQIHTGPQHWTFTF